MIKLILPRAIHLNKWEQETLLSSLGWRGGDWGRRDRRGCGCLGCLGSLDQNEVSARYTIGAIVDHNGFALDITLLSWEDDIGVLVAGLSFAFLGGWQVTVFT